MTKIFLSQRFSVLPFGDMMMIVQEENDNEELLLTVLSFFPIDFNQTEQTRI